MIRQLAIAILAAPLILGACAAPQQSSKAPAATTGAETALKTARGTFEGRSDHITTGHAAIARDGKHWVVILENDFTFDGAPDPHVALGNDGYDKNASLALLSSNNGRQVYAIPASLDVADFNEVWIWCNRFAVPLGVAQLTLL